MQEQLSLWDMPDFDGATYEADRDHDRLGKQMVAVRDMAMNWEWITLQTLAELTGYPEASVSARLRDLRKPKFGSYTVERRYEGGGLWSYRVTK
jgi:RIO-like serine/threonine protein kinase